MLYSTKIGSLPVEVEYDCVRDVDGYYEVDWGVISVGNKKCRQPPNWLYKKMDWIDVMVLEDELILNWKENG